MNRRVSHMMWGRLFIVQLIMFFSVSGSLWASEQDGFYPGLGGDFRLQSAEGDVQLSSLPGEWKLLGFGYSHCPHICSMLLAKMNQVYKKIGDDSDQLGVVFVSIDSKRDSGEGLTALQMFVNRFNTAFVGLSGTESELKAVTKQYAVYFGEERVNQVKGAEKGVEQVDISHTDRIYLINRAGRVKKIYSRNVDTDLVAKELSQLLGR